MHAVKKIARVVSDLFIPPTFNLLGFIYLALVTQFNTENRIVIISSALIFAVILPITFFVILRKKKIITDNDAVIKEERHYPFYLYIVLSLCGFIYVSMLGDNSVADHFWLAITFNTIGLTVINYFWKISVHAIGGATFAGLLFFMGSGLFIYFLILIMLVGISRYILKVHTPAQIIAGTLFGFLLTVLQMNIFNGEF